MSIDKSSLLTRSPNKTVVLRSYWRFHQLLDPTASEKTTIDNVFWIGISRLYMLHAAHVFTLKIYFDGEFLAIKKTCFVIIQQHSRYYDGWKIGLETKICEGKLNLSKFNWIPLTCFWSREEIFPTCVCVSCN